MTKKEQISKFLQEWNGDGYTVQDVYIEKECADLMAEGIVKLFSIPDVIDCECDSDNYTKHETKSGIVIYKCHTCGGCL